MTNQGNKAFPLYFHDIFPLALAKFLPPHGPSSGTPHFWDTLQCSPAQDPNLACWTISEWFQGFLRGQRLCGFTQCKCRAAKSSVFLRCPSKEGICQLASLHIKKKEFMEVLPVSYCHDILVFKQQQYRCFNTSQYRHSTDTTIFSSISQECLELPGVCREAQWGPNSAQGWCSWCQKQTVSPLFVTGLMRHGSALPSLSVQLQCMLPSIHTFFQKTGSFYTKWQQLSKSSSKHVLAHTN